MTVRLDPGDLGFDVVGDARLARALPAGLPPITADPPEHTWSRRLLLPWSSHQRVARYEPLTRELCRRLAVVIAARGHGGAAVQVAKQIPLA